MPVQRNKAIVGQNAFAHESGIHQDGMLKHQGTYEIMRPESVGLASTRLVLGKHSGRAALRSRLHQMGHASTERRSIACSSASSDWRMGRSGLATMSSRSSSTRGRCDHGPHAVRQDLGRARRRAGAPAARGPLRRPAPRARGHVAAGLRRAARARASACGVPTARSPRWITPRPPRRAALAVLHEDRRPRRQLETLRRNCRELRRPAARRSARHRRASCT